MIKIVVAALLMVSTCRSGCFLFVASMHASSVGYEHLQRCRCRSDVSDVWSYTAYFNSSFFASYWLSTSATPASHCLAFLVLLLLPLLHLRARPLQHVRIAMRRSNHRPGSSHFDL